MFTTFQIINHTAKELVKLPPDRGEGIHPANTKTNYNRKGIYPDFFIFI